MKYLTLITVFLIASKAYSFEVVYNPNLPPPGYEPLEVTGNATPWHIFAKTGEIEKCIVDEEGFDYCDITPEYSKDILDLDGKEITLMGFMFPLGETEDQVNFLIGPYPLSCPFNYHSPPSQIVEVITETPVKFSWDPVIIKGTLEVRYNNETGVFYYLKGI